MADDGSKIFIDEDWKARAQREKEELQRKLAGQASEPAADADAASGEADSEDEGELQATFDELIGSLATQGMFALGLISQGGGDRVMINLDQARFTIEMLMVLQDKTKGNLTEQEQANLEETVTELQRLFMARVQQLEAQAMRQTGIDPNSLRVPQE